MAERLSLDLLFFTVPERTEDCAQADPVRKLPKTNKKINLKAGFIRG
jgi:hypothetical protein